VRLAILGFHEKFDLVISGINRGLNIGRDIMYSGTVSAVFEAGNLDTKAMAVSTTPAYYDHAAEEMDKIWDYVMGRDLFSKNLMYNINIPTGGSEEFRITRQGGNYYSDDFRAEENHMYFPCGKDVFAPCGSKELDTDAVMVDKVISVMPLTMDRTNLELFLELRK
jgi:5'-nucleotidase